ncbi:hydrogenase nickel incorporation protein HypB [Rhodopseudomonas rhenobacensis]|uniref:Hydrogenase maturation factor HypB n=1 Tax=Rhodopseudomonas rhenobacensis TaxID=87461 RepID=A0A7W7Z8N3_9BRAD|nr:hydrogenase nickel incorporation protein HypB [Rhodopseudomonas rhenobacensis]MBB5049934.1 hydrogenase nickel incorporation protein HypB [Rhodopseudomonas rhenobacensis]
MCAVCGCGQATVEGQPLHDHDDHDDLDEAAHAALHAAGTPHGHHHDHPHDHHHAEHDHHDHAAVHYGAGAAGVSVPGLDQRQIIKLERAVLSHNDGLAQANRARFAQAGILTLNLLSSPGSGKTTLLCATIAALAGRLPVAVIEGDQQTSFDADRIRESGAPAIQVNTGKGCHLDAAMVADAYQRLDLPEGAVLFVENVGNLVCPAAFDLGEAAKVVILSVTEGEDKPLKYPDMFAAADLMILNKIDLAPYVSFNVERCLELAHRVNPRLSVLQLSATTGEGLAAWVQWIEARQRELA